MKTMTIYGVYVASQGYDCRTEDYSGYKKSLVELCSSEETANELVRKLIEDKVSEMKEKGFSQEIISLIEKNITSINFTHGVYTWYEDFPLYHVDTVSVVTEV